MNFEKKHLVYLGVIVLAGLVVYSSTRKEEIVEVTDPTIQKQASADGQESTFNHSMLPFQLRPPTRLSEGEPIPQNIVKKNVIGINLKPRMDGL
jgi:hypothetical protein